MTRILEGLVYALIAALLGVAAWMTYTAFVVEGNAGLGFACVLGFVLGVWFASDFRRRRCGGTTIVTVSSAGGLAVGDYFVLDGGHTTGLILSIDGNCVTYTTRRRRRC